MSNSLFECTRFKLDVMLKMTKTQLEFILDVQEVEFPIFQINIAKPTINKYL